MTWRNLNRNELFKFQILGWNEFNLSFHLMLIFILCKLTDISEDSKLVHRRKRSKVNAASPRFFLLFCDAFERRLWLSAESKILASTFGRFRLYRLRAFRNFILKWYGSENLNNLTLPRSRYWNLPLIRHDTIKLDSSNIWI